MKNVLYVSMIALALGSCTNDLSEEVGLLSKEVVEVSLPDIESRTIMDGNSVKWESTDHIGIFKTSSQSYINNDFELKSGANTTSAKFGADQTQGENNVLAYYPYSATASYNGTTLILPLADNYTYGTTTHAVMAAELDGGKAENIAFKNAGTLVAITIKNIPDGYTKLVMSATEKIAGNAKVTFNNGIPTLAIADDASSTSITIDFTNNSDATRTFYFPVPVCEYSNGLKLTLTGDNQADKVVGTLKNSNTDATFSAKRNEIHRHTVTYNDQASGGIEEVVTTSEDLAEKLSEGGAVILGDDVTELSVESLEVPQNVSSVLDLNGKTLALSASARSALVYGINNSGTLTIKNGIITASADYIAAIYNSGTLTITASTINSNQRGIINNGTATLNCNITSETSNAVCGYGDGTNVITIEGGTYTASATTPNTSALRMDPRKDGNKDGGQVDKAWNLTINGGTFVSNNWVALEMLNNYYNLGDGNEGWAKINGGTFTGSKDHADIGGVAVENITISNQCVLTNNIIKNQTNGNIAYSCEMNGYNLQDNDNHYDEVFVSYVFANGGSHTLANNINFGESLVVPAEKEVTLNLGNYTFTSTDDLAAIINNGTLELVSGENGGIEASYRGIINNGTATLNCNITSENSNAVCGYGDGTNVITIEGGTYTASATTPNTSALRMDPRKDGNKDGSQVDKAWNLTINGGVFVSESWVALEMLNNYYNLGDGKEGWAKINGGTFTGSTNHADIGGVAVENITINTDACVLTNNSIKNQTDGDIKYSCVMNGYDLQDKENHYTDVKNAYDSMKSTN